MFDSFLDQLDPELLLKLLSTTKEVNHNHPFSIFLNEYKICNGPHMVEPKLLITLYKLTRKRNSITEKKVLEFLDVKLVRGLPKVLINFTEAQIKGKIRNKDTKALTKITPLLKKKFENFVKDNEIYTYQQYDKWFTHTRRDNQLTEKEFEKLYKLYFNKEL